MNVVPKKSIRRKVAKRVVIALVVTVVVLSTVNLIYMSRHIRDEQEKELELATNLCVEEIDGWVNEMCVIAEDISYALGGLQTVDEKTVKKILNQVAANHTELFFVYVGTESGDINMARGVQLPVGYDPRDRDWYKMAKASGHTVITNPYLSASRGDTILITVATPIYFGTEMIGVAAVDADIATINDYVKSIDFKNGSYGFLVDTDENIVAHENEEYLPTVNDSQSIEEVLPELKPIFDKPGTDMITAVDYTGEKMVYYTERLKKSGWIIGVAYPESNIMKIIDRSIRISIAIAIFFIIFAAVDMTRAIKKILRPIDKINPMMDRIIEGDFSTKLEISNEEDELGMLQAKMAHMVANLSDSIHKQKYVLGEMEKGNLVVENIENFPGEYDEISKSVNSIKESFNDIISDIQFSAINLQSFAMGINETSNLEEMRLVFEELSAEANALMDKTSKFITVPPQDIEE